MGLITENMCCGSGAEKMAEAANLLSMRVPERHGCFKSLLLRYMVQAGNGTILAVSCLFFVLKSTSFSRVTVGNTFTESFQIPDKASALTISDKISGL